MTREDIEKCFSYHAAGAALEYYEQEHLQSSRIESNDVVNAFESGADWAQKFFIDKACEWLKQNMYVEPVFEHDEDEEPEMYVCASACNSVDELVNNFRKAMEE